MGRQVRTLLYCIIYIRGWSIYIYTLPLDNNKYNYKINTYFWSYISSIFRRSLDWERKVALANDVDLIESVSNESCLQEIQKLDPVSLIGIVTNLRRPESQTAGESSTPSSDYLKYSDMGRGIIQEIVKTGIITLLVLTRF